MNENNKLDKHCNTKTKDNALISKASNLFDFLLSLLAYIGFRIYLTHMKEFSICCLLSFIWIYLIHSFISKMQMNITLFYFIILKMQNFAAIWRSQE